jgi:hypothetical protein
MVIIQPQTFFGPPAIMSGYLQMAALDKNVRYCFSYARQLFSIWPDWKNCKLKEKFHQLEKQSVVLFSPGV